MCAAFASPRSRATFSKILYESLIDRDRATRARRILHAGLARREDRPATRRRARSNSACSIPPAARALSCFTRCAIFSREAEEAGHEPKTCGRGGLRACRRHGHSSGRRHHRARHLSAGAGTGARHAHGLALDSGLSRRLHAVVDQRVHGRKGADHSRAAAAGGRRQEREKDENGHEQLDFPDTFCRDPALFDKAIERMRTGSEAGHDAQADRGGAFSHHGAALSRRRDRRAEARRSTISARPM